jgi:hypothetical protein
MVEGGVADTEGIVAAADDDCYYATHWANLKDSATLAPLKCSERDAVVV